MLSVAELEIMLKARDQMSQVLAQAGNNLKGFGATMDRVVRPALLSMAAAAATFIGTAGVMIRTVAESQASQASLDAAVRATGASFDDIRTKQLDAFVQSLEHFSGFSRNEVRDALALLVFQTGDVQEAMTRERVAVDFARGAHLSLYDASKLLGKVTDETINVLARWGIHVDKNTTSTELFSLIMQRFAGQGSTYADSLEGKWAKVQNRFADLIDDFSKKLIPFVSKLLDGAEDAEKKVNDLLPEIQKWIDKNPDMIAFAGAITAVSFAFAGLAFIAAVLTSPAGAIALVAGALYSIYSNIQLIVDNWPKFTKLLSETPPGKFLGEVWNDLSEIATEIQIIGDSIRNLPVVGGIVTGGGLPGGTMLPGKNGPSSFTSAALQQAVSQAVPFVSGLTLAVTLANPSLASALHNAHIPGFAQGGVVPGPIGDPMLAIVHGGETVSRPSQGRGFGSLTVNVNVAGSVGVDDLREQILATVREAIQGGGFRGVLSGGR